MVFAAADSSPVAWLAVICASVITHTPYIRPAPAGPVYTPELRQRILDLRNGGRSLRTIAETLIREGVPTARGAAAWSPSSVQRAAEGYVKRPTRRKRSDPPEPRKAPA